MTRRNSSSAVRGGMLAAIAMMLSGCSLLGDDASGAPQCAEIDPLLLRLSDVQGATDFASSVRQNLEGIPSDALTPMWDRIKAGQTSLDQKNGANVGQPSELVAVLHASAKSETRASGDFRYCKGVYDVGNGQSLAWTYSMTSENGTPVFRLLGSTIEGSARAVAPVPTSTNEATANAEAPVAEETTDGAIPGVDMPVADADGLTASPEDTTAETPVEAEPDAGFAAQRAAELAALEQARLEAERAKREADAARRELERQRQAAAQQREAEQRAAQEAQEAQERTLQSRNSGEIAVRSKAARTLEESPAPAPAPVVQAPPSPTIDELYEQRKLECPRGFFGSECRSQIREQLCAGRWSAAPPAGEAQCRR